MTDQPNSSTEASAEAGPAVTVAADDGAVAMIHPHGAHVTSWKPAGGAEQLFLSKTADYGPKVSIRGGIPVVFPQFANLGELPKHGFVRVATWIAGETRVLPGGNATSVWHLRDDEATRVLWPHSFEAEYEITVGAATFAARLAIRNMGTEAFTFTAALHSYLSVQDITKVAVLGLQDVRYRDSANGGAEAVQGEAELKIVGEVDRIYLDAPWQVVLREADRELTIESESFTDVVVWNPGPTKGAALVDLEPEGYTRMLCIESAVIGTPVELTPGELWHGTQTLRLAMTG